MRAEGAECADSALFHTVLLTVQLNSKTIMRNKQSHIRGRAVKTPKPAFPTASLMSEPLSILQGASSAFPMLSPLESISFSLPGIL